MKILQFKIEYFNYELFQSNAFKKKLNWNAASTKYSSPIRKHHRKCYTILHFMMSDLLKGIYNPIKLNLPPSIFNRLFYMMAMFLRKFEKVITFV